MKFFILALLTSCAGHSVLLQGKGISMTREAVNPGETLQTIKPIKARFCIGFGDKRPEAAVDVLVKLAQKGYKADFIRDFKVTEEMVHPFKSCYQLQGVAVKVVKVP